MYFIKDSIQLFLFLSCNGLNDNSLSVRFASKTLSCAENDPALINGLFPIEFSLFSYNNGMVMSSCRELDNNRSALSAASAFAIATAGANEGTPTKEKYRRMSLASTGTHTYPVSNPLH